MAEAAHPVRLRIDDDLQRNRLTVFFRLLLAIPHYIWLFIWSIGAFLAWIANWLATLATGRPPHALHRFLSAYLRYGAHLNAYLLLVANPYPGFTGERGYPFEVELPEEPVEQPRWKTLLRILLVIPAVVLSTALSGPLVGSSGGYAQRRGRYRSYVNVGGGFLGVASAFLGWFAILVRGAMPKGLRDAGAYSIGYGAQTLAYVLLLTDRYPNADPNALLAGVEPPPAHPVAVAVADDLVRSRVTVFFRVLLAVPHFIWFFLWTAASILASIVQWFATLARGTPLASLQRFLGAYIRYRVHAYAFLFLVANPFPGFTGAPGTYPVDVQLPEPEEQRRVVTFFRFLLSIPVWIIGSALESALFVAGVLTWFAALATGRAPEGLRNLGVYALRYTAQSFAYVYLLTERYPHASPLAGRDPSPPSEAEFAPTG